MGSDTRLRLCVEKVSYLDSRSPYGERRAKRVTVTAPEYTAVDATKVSALQGDAVINYGGLEDD